MPPDTPESDPAFPEAELKRHRAAALAHLPQIRNEPVVLAGMAAHELLYGQEHPYGRPQFGSAKTLRSLTRADIEPLAQGIVAWHKQLAPAGETTVVFRDSAFADDVAKTNLTAILQQHGLENVRSL